MGALLRFYAQALWRNPWAWTPSLALPLLALALGGRGEGVAVVSLYALLSLFLPPMVLALATPLLGAREEWAFWGGMPRPPGLLYVAGILGVGLGLSLPVGIGLALAAGFLGFSPKATLLLSLSGLLLLWIWVALGGWVAAGLEAGRALGQGLFLWGLLVLAYDPLVVALAVALREFPLEGLLLALVLLNPMDLLRVGLLYALEVPVLVGPTGYLLKETLGYTGGVLPLGVGLGFVALGIGGAYWRFVLRDR